MATKFLDPGGDATFNVALTTAGGFWQGVNGTTAIATDFVHGAHIKSIKFFINSSDNVRSPSGVLADAGSRISFYVYFNSLDFITLMSLQNGLNSRVTLQINSGVLGLFSNTSPQIGSNGPTLVAGRWYRISLAYTITSTTVNRFELFVDAVSAISVTNATIAGTGTNILELGNILGDDSDTRISDIYVDNSAALTDPGNIWVTAKRPNANGTTNGYTTQIGSGGSGYGTGHSPQVNERALSTTNGWSMIGAGSAITEEYNIESTSTGDIDISAATIVDYVGWVYSSALASETASIVVNNVSSNISLTSTNTMFTAVAGSSSYPAGTGTDIGEVTTTALTTVSLYECGIIVAYIPPAAATAKKFLPIMGVGS